MIGRTSVTSQTTSSKNRLPTEKLSEGFTSPLSLKDNIYQESLRPGVGNKRTTEQPWCCLLVKLVTCL